MSIARDIAHALADAGGDALVRDRLAEYAARLLERTAAVNLTAARSPVAIAAHVHDSLELVSYVREPLVDIGSGGGFPGIPLAIATGFRVTLVESVAKKAAFLTEIVAALQLPVTVLCVRAEDMGRDKRYRGTFASATARAVSSVPTVLELTVPLLAIGGVALLQRGRLEPRERVAAADASLVLGAEILAEVPIAGSDDEAGEAWREGDGAAGHGGRRLLIVRKIAATGPRFPRRAGIPAKRPLCYELGADA